MTQANDPAYIGREQSLIKHTILQKYLERFAHIVGSFQDAITYVDGFSGPWNCRSENLTDSSFSIALEQLRKARKTLKEQRNRNLAIRCYFLEKDRQAFQALQSFARSQSDVEIVVKNAEFEDSINDIIEFIRRGPQKNFPFVFIDPTGWRGFSLSVIAPLIKLIPCEVLINFMTGHIIRFIEAEDEDIDASFTRLFGDATFRDSLHGLTGREREDAIVFTYAKRVGDVGGYNYVPVTVVPHPEKNSAYFHLVYATRSLKGLEVFKDSEKAALRIAGELRADAKRRKREETTRQAELLPGKAMPDTSYIDSLHEHYQHLARERVLQLLATRKPIKYDQLYMAALLYPLVTRQDLRDWIAELADIDGLNPRETVPKVGANHYVKLRN